MSISNAVVEMSEAVAGHAPVGETLRAGRLARGMSVDDLAQALKLGRRQVEALEGGDWDSLPGQTFIRGFVRNYARIVQLDTDALMAQLDAVLGTPADTLQVRGEAAPARMPRPPGAGGGRDRLVVLLGLGLVLLAGLAYLTLPENVGAWRDQTQRLLDNLGGKPAAPAPASPAEATPAPAAPEPLFPPGATPQQVLNPQAVSDVAPAASAAETAGAGVAPAQLVPAAAAPAQPSAATPPAAAPMPAQGVAPAVLQPAAADAAGRAAPDTASTPPQLRFVFVKDSWVEVRDRNKKAIFAQRGVAGAERKVSGQGPLSLNIGYAPGVKLYWRGELIDLAPHTSGDVARLVLE